MKPRALLLAASSLLAATSLNAASLWNGTSGAWANGDAAIWDAPFTAGDNVAFASAFTTTRAITVDAAGVAPASMTASTFTGTLTISGGAIGGTLSKSGTGTLVLSSANNFTGTTTLSGGTLTVATATSLGTSSVNVTGNSRINFGIVGINNAVSVNSGVTLSVSGGYYGTPAVISGSGAVNAVGNIELFGVNTYSGGTTVSGGYLCINSDASLGATPASFQANNITLSGGSVSTYGATGAVTLNANRGITMTANGIFDTNGQNLTVNGVITGGFQLTKQAGSELTLAGANTYSGGTRLTGGTLRIANSDSALGTGMLTVTTGTANASVTNGLATQIGGGARTLANNISITNNGTGVTTLRLDGGYANLTLNGVISGNGSLATTSSGNVILGGLNTYTGTTTVSGTNTLTIASTGQVRVNGVAGITINASTTLLVNGKLLMTTATDTLSNSGTLTVTSASAILDLNGLFNAYNGGASGTYNLVTGAGANSGSFSTVTGYNTAVWSNVVYNAGQLIFTAVPEPSTTVCWARAPSPPPPSCVVAARPRKQSVDARNAGTSGCRRFGVSPHDSGEDGAPAVAKQPSRSLSSKRGTVSSRLCPTSHAPYPRRFFRIVRPRPVVRRRAGA